MKRVGLQFFSRTHYTINISTSPAIYCYTNLMKFENREMLPSFHVERDNY